MEQKRMSVTEYVKKIGANSEKHGFHAVNTRPNDQLVLIHCEVSEVVEELRKGKGLTEVYYNEAGKPEGIPIELADIVIRCMDFADQFGIDLEAAINEKMAYNETRPYLHGKKF